MHECFISKTRSLSPNNNLMYPIHVTAISKYPNICSQSYVLTKHWSLKNYDWCSHINIWADRSQSETFLTEVTFEGGCKMRRV